jgi:hypothetical protein
LFKYFPSKEALVFGREDDQEAALVTAVRDRAAGQSIPVALQARQRSGPIPATCAARRWPASPWNPSP